MKGTLDGAIQKTELDNMVESDLGCYASCDGQRNPLCGVETEMIRGQADRALRDVSRQREQEMQRP